MELVKHNKEIEKELEELKDSERMYTVLNQKQLRIKSTTQQREGDIREIEASIRSLQNDMQKLNALVEKNGKIQAQLTEGNFDLENAFHTQLKQSGSEAVQLEGKLNTIREEKQNVLHDIVEAE